MSLKHKIQNIVNFPKSLYVNLKLFPIKTALKFPVWVRYDTKLGKLEKNKIQFETACIKPKMLRIGVEGQAGAYGNQKTYFSIDKNAQLVIKDKIQIAEKSTFIVDGKMKIGSNFYANTGCFIVCCYDIEIGDDVLLGWNVNIRDIDGHSIISGDGERKESKKKIYIGNHVWLCAHTHILKGVSIPDDCVVGYGSIVTRKFEHSNTVIAGYPAKVLQENVNWIK